MLRPCGPSFSSAVWHQPCEVLLRVPAQSGRVGCRRCCHSAKACGLHSKGGA